ncbi:MAG: DUF1934 domain-containing protein [Hungatella sp.]|nr:DUF1934 domain-containing protein [Hungatella sp.]
MTREVLVTIAGVRTTDGEPEEIALCVPGSYYHRNGKHYICYDQLWEDGSVTKSTIKLSPCAMEIIRKGSMAAHMIFEQGKTHGTGYGSLTGEPVMEFVTNKFSLAEREEGLEAEVDYSLRVCGELVSDCRMKVSVAGRHRETGQDHIG